MEVYRKIAVAKAGEDLRQIEIELADIYGPVPDEAALLLELAELRIAAGKRDIKSIIASGQNLVFSFAKAPAAHAESLFAKVTGTVRIADSKTVYLRLSRSYFEPKTLISVLRRILNQ